MIIWIGVRDGGARMRESLMVQMKSVGIKKKTRDD